jgi:hypothetical protein
MVLRRRRKRWRRWGIVIMMAEGACVLGLGM